MHPSTTRTLLLLLLVVASLAVLLGAFAKIQHWPTANYFLVGGMAMELICGIGFAVVSWKSRSGNR
jgi:hypothetical protein